MKASIITMLICTVLYAGIGALNNTKNNLVEHKNSLENAVALMEG